MGARLIHRISFCTLSLLGTFGKGARAEGLCDYYRSHMPSLYEIACKSKTATSRPAGASSSFSSAFNLTAGSLPTEPSSYGLETLTAQIRSNGSISPTFSLVKGFNKFGTGLSTGSSNTFYGDDVVQRLYGPPKLTTFKPPEKARGEHLPNLNLGTAVKLFDFKRGPSLNLGVSVRYNRITDRWGGGPALVMRWTNFTLGVAGTRESVSNALPRTRFNSYQASVRISRLEFEYNLLTHSADTRLSPVHIFTATITYGRLILTGAIRRLDYYSAGSVDQNSGAFAPTLTGMVTQRHFAIQYLFSKNVSAGFLYNHIPGASTLGLQLFL